MLCSFVERALWKVENFVDNPTAAQKSAKKSPARARQKERGKVARGEGVACGGRGKGERRPSPGEGAPRGQKRRGQCCGRARYSPSPRMRTAGIKGASALFRASISSSEKGSSVQPGGRVSPGRKFLQVVPLCPAQPTADLLHVRRGVQPARDGRAQLVGHVPAQQEGGALADRVHIRGHARRPRVLRGGVLDVHRHEVDQPFRAQRFQPCGEGAVGVQLDGVAERLDLSEQLPIRAWTSGSPPVTHTPSKIPLRRRRKASSSSCGMSSPPCAKAISAFWQ